MNNQNINKKAFKLTSSPFGKREGVHITDLRAPRKYESYTLMDIRNCEIAITAKLGDLQDELGQLSHKTFECVSRINQLYTQPNQIAYQGAVNSYKSLFRRQQEILIESDRLYGELKHAMDCMDDLLPEDTQFQLFEGGSL